MLVEDFHTEFHFNLSNRYIPWLEGKRMGEGGVVDAARGRGSRSNKNSLYQPRTSPDEIIKYRGKEVGKWAVGGA